VESLLINIMVTWRKRKQRGRCIGTRKLTTMTTKMKMTATTRTTKVDALASSTERGGGGGKWQEAMKALMRNGYY